MEGISPDAERLFARLIMKADDYGRFYADPRLVKAGCFPLEDQIRLNDLVRWLDELSHRQLILRYEVHGRSYLALPNWGQRMRETRAKFPPPDGEPDNWLPDAGGGGQMPAVRGSPPQPAATCRKSRPETESESDLDSESETEAEGAPKPPPGAAHRKTAPTLADCRSWAAMGGGTPAQAEAFWQHFEAQGWVTARGLPITNARAKLAQWIARDRGGAAPTAARAGGEARKPVGELTDAEILRSAL